LCSRSLRQLLQLEEQDRQETATAGAARYCSATLVVSVEATGSFTQTVSAIAS
jgi:hypothetical protein